MNFAIPRFDHCAQYADIREDVLSAIDRVLSSNSLILGPNVAALEQQISNYLKITSQGIGVGNGTDALALALRALNISNGDEVITVANTAIATMSAIRMVGATPVFCDIDPETLQMNPAEVRRKVSSKTKAIIPVHLFGNAVDMAEVCRIAGLFGLRVIEDCAQSFGTTIHGRPTGTWGDVGCFSFYPTKNLGAYGDGGMCVTTNRELAETIRRMRTYGCAAGEPAECEGINSRLDELQAAVLEVKLQHFPRYLDRRREIGRIYNELLPRRCRIPATTAGAVHSYHLYVVRVQNRDRVLMRLRADGIECGVHYPLPLHRMAAYRFLNCPIGSLPNTELIAGQLLSLPCYPELSDDAVKKVCHAVEKAICE